MRAPAWLRGNKGGACADVVRCGLGEGQSAHRAAGRPVDCRDGLCGPNIVKCPHQLRKRNRKDAGMTARVGG